jgi:hypothetical protein
MVERGFNSRRPANPEHISIKFVISRSEVKSYKNPLERAGFFVALFFRSCNITRN